MAKKPMQFQVSEKMRQDIEDAVKHGEISLSDFLRQSVRIYIVLSEYHEQGYRIILKKDDTGTEREIILP